MVTRYPTCVWPCAGHWGPRADEGSGPCPLGPEKSGQIQDEVSFEKRDWCWWREGWGKGGDHTEEAGESPRPRWTDGGAFQAEGTA